MASYRTIEGDMLDLICWAYYGREGGAVEAVLEANPGLAAQGPIYPAGVLVELPELAPESAAQAPVRLWD